MYRCGRGRGRGRGRRRHVLLLLCMWWKMFNLVVIIVIVKATLSLGETSSTSSSCDCCCYSCDFSREFSFGGGLGRINNFSLRFESSLSDVIGCFFVVSLGFEDSCCGDLDSGYSTLFDLSDVYGVGFCDIISRGNEFCGSDGHWSEGSLCDPLSFGYSWSDCHGCRFHC